MTDTAALQQLADRLEILNLLAGSALSSDVSSEVFQRSLYAERSVLDRHPALPKYEGRDRIAGIMRDPDHIEHVEGGMVHLASQPFVRVSGDRAIACGYLEVVRTAADAAPTESQDAYSATAADLWMVTANVWEFEREKDHWLMVRRTIRDALSAEGRELIRAALERP